MKKLGLIFLALLANVSVAFGYDKDLALPNNSYYIPRDSNEIHSSNSPHFIEGIDKGFFLAEPIIHFSDYDKAYNYWCDIVVYNEYDYKRSNEGISDKKVKQYIADKLDRCKAELKAMKENPANQSFWHRFLIDCPKDSSQAECKRRFESAKNLFLPFDKSSCSGGSGWLRDTCCYFEPYEKTQGNNMNRHCLYRANKPLHLKGKLILHQNNARDSRGLELIPYDKDLDILEIANLVFYDVEANTNKALKDTKFIYDNLPKWFHNGLNGEVGFEVEFDLNDKMPQNRYATLGEIIHNKDTYHTARVDISNLAFVKVMDGGTDNALYVKNFKITKLLYDKPDTPQDYTEFALDLATKDSFVNLRDEPNGKVLAKIYKKDMGKFIVAHNYAYGEYPCSSEVWLDQLDGNKWWWLWFIDGFGYTTRGVGQGGRSQYMDFDSELKNISQLNGDSWVQKARKEHLDKLKSLKDYDKWVRVIYFPPNAKSANDAIVGYIHKSQLDVEDYETECEI